MRTDSTRLSEDAKKLAKEYIVENFGKKYYLDRTITLKKFLSHKIFYKFYVRKK